MSISLLLLLLLSCPFGNALKAATASQKNFTKIENGFREVLEGVSGTIIETAAYQPIVCLSLCATGSATSIFGLRMIYNSINNLGKTYHHNKLEQHKTVQQKNGPAPYAPYYRPYWPTALHSLLGLTAFIGGGLLTWYSPNFARRASTR